MPGDVRRALHVDGFWGMVHAVSSRPTGVCRGLVPEPGPRVVTESYLAEWVLKYSDMVVRLFMQRTDVHVLYCQSCSRRVRCTGRAWSCLVARDRVGSWGCSAALGGMVARGGTGSSCRGQ